MEREFERRWQEKSRRMFDNSEAKKAFDNVFDHYTKKALMKLSDRGVLSQLYGTIESGKESKVFLADTPDGERVLVKIYMTRAGGFREMEQYLRGDPRFESFKSDRRSIIEEWCKKEYRNLQKAQDVVKCPKPIATEKNILVMEFIGQDFSPFPKLKEVEIENPELGWKKTKKAIKKLWEEQKLVHGDLSEYNILVTDEPALAWIDFSQGVHRTHPRAKELLERDIQNTAKFFRSQGAETDEQNFYNSLISD
ncbi:serine protein kinase RIO [Candidatus Nanohalococcus occultus]|uniref:non-specific serine/threonine protein kinase n=1 Tax=Candidatus Nanohalococcus occultus TaxID=2978047 RepID=A0ABY8CFH9_9ARCH|nr:Serine/threonine protein kinase involved in cellcycle control [Candidatus Nanohaloarchaeota archaeon SVXNc]